MAKYAFLFVLLLYSCRSAELISDELELSLEIAGDHRKEFEFVLEHFKQDRKKYEAACFLIENMQYH
ncbi:MAG: hypothetical protein LUD68_00130 [Rikenellaceae bacterium]|nr:hypothetical protein [Rikenellaceae bacterium]